MFRAHESHSVLSPLHADAPAVALALSLSLSSPFSGSQPNPETGSNAGGGDLGDRSQTLFHLPSAGPGSRSNVSFSPLQRGRASLPNRASLSLTEQNLCLPLFLNSALTDLPLIEKTRRQDKPSYAFQFLMHPRLPCWGERLNMCLFPPLPLQRLQWMK